MYWGADFRVDFAVGACVDFVEGRLEEDEHEYEYEHGRWWDGNGMGGCFNRIRKRYGLMILYLAGVKEGSFSFCLDMLT